MGIAAGDVALGPEVRRTHARVGAEPAEGDGNVVKGGGTATWGISSDSGERLVVDALDDVAEDDTEAEDGDETRHGFVDIWRRLGPHFQSNEPSNVVERLR